MDKLKLTFTGHETFYCKNLWLKKGYDFIIQDKKFNSEDAIVDLGVGKNMINSIKFWLKAFTLTKTEDSTIMPSKLANKIFPNNGFDPYLEDIGTVWLLHYLLVKNKIAPIYFLFFNKFRKQNPEFTKTKLLNYIKSLCVGNNVNFNSKTVEKDINVFFQNYMNKEKKGSIVDNFSNFLSDLNLISKKEYSIDKKELKYSIERKTRKNLSYKIIFFTILDNYQNEVSISFKKLMNDINSPGNIFVLHEDDLKNKIIQITEKFNDVVYRENAGIGNFQIKTKFDKWQILEDYYAK